MLPLTVLMATRPRIEQLICTSLPSIKAQLLQPELVVIVSDSKSLSLDEQARISHLLAPLPVQFLTNKYSPGAAGSWNTGIEALSERYDDAYIAILDDDDYWLPNHLSLCMSHTDDHPDLVLSGIEVRTTERSLAINIPDNLEADDFLIRNPGWQGSNTFVRLALLVKIGGFTNGLISSNDRDLAIRILNQPCLHVAYTRNMTVVWRCQQLPDALSAPGSPQKRKGCAQFLMLHGHRMSAHVMNEYFRTIETRFDLYRTDVEEELKQMGTCLDNIRHKRSHQI